MQIDLGAAARLEAILLVSALPADYPHTPGFGFPVRFKIEVSKDPECALSIMLLDQTGADHPVRTYRPFRLDANGVEARYIRVTATKLWKREGDYVFALCRIGFEVESSRPAQVGWTGVECGCHA